MKKCFLFSVLALLFCSQLTLATSSTKIHEQELKPVISVDEFIPLEKKVIFDARKSEFALLSKGTPSISWNLGDGTPLQWGEQIVHSFEKTGKYQVILSIKQGLKREKIAKNVFVYSQKGILITQNENRVTDLTSEAGKNGIWLKPIVLKNNETGVSADEKLWRKLQKNLDFIKESDFLIFDTNNPDEMQSFAQWWAKLLNNEKFSPTAKIWIQIGKSGDLAKMKKLLYPTFSILNPREIFVIRDNSLALFFEKPYEEIYSQLKNRGLDYEIINNNSQTIWLLPISKLKEYFIFRGISKTVLYLLLAVPFIVFLISFTRQFVGLKTFGVFSLLMLTLAFMLLGLNFGFTIFVLVLGLSFLLRKVFDKFELLYIPRLALLYSAIALSFFLILGLAVYFDTPVQLALAIFPMMVMSTISEKFISAQAVSGLKTTILTAGETVLVALVAYFLVSWGWLQNNILALPELIFLPMLGNIWLGKFTGLRLTEYFKFRTLFKEDSQE